MTLPVQAVRTVYTGNNTAAPIPIAHESTAIWFRDKSHIHVAALDSYGVEVPLVEGTDYDISGVNEDGYYKNSAVVPVEDIPDGVQWAIWREQPLEQDAQFGFNSPYDSTIAERTHDRSRQLDQEQADAIVRAIKISRFATAPQPNLPRDITDKFLVGQADGTLWPLAPEAPGTVCVDADGRAFVVPPDYGGSTGINRYTFGTSPHTGPIPGDVWVNSTTGNVAFWLPLGAGYYDWYFYDDGDIHLPFAGTGIADTIARSDHTHTIADITDFNATSLDPSRPRLNVTLAPWGLVPGTVDVPTGIGAATGANCNILQNAINYAVANNMILYSPYHPLGYGIYGPLVLPNGLIWESDPGTVHYRDKDGITFITQADLATSIKVDTWNLSIASRPSSPLVARGGVGFSVNLVDSYWFRPQILGWDLGNQGFNILIYGKTLIDHPVAICDTTDVGTGAFRINGGEDSKVRDLYGVCGDDVAQYVMAATPPADGATNVFNRRMKNLCIDGVRGRSTMARLVIFGIDNSCNANIENCEFKNVHGSALGDSALRMSNSSYDRNALSIATRDGAGNGTLVCPLDSRGFRIFQANEIVDILDSSDPAWNKTVTITGVGNQSNQSTGGIGSSVVFSNGASTIQLSTTWASRSIAAGQYITARQTATTCLNNNAIFKIVSIAGNVATVTPAPISETVTCTITNKVSLFYADVGSVGTAPGTLRLRRKFPSVIKNCRVDGSIDCEASVLGKYSIVTWGPNEHPVIDVKIANPYKSIYYGFNKVSDLRLRLRCDEVPIVANCNPIICRDVDHSILDLNIWSSTGLDAIQFTKEATLGDENVDFDVDRVARNTEVTGIIRGVAASRWMANMFQGNGIRFRRLLVEQAAGAVTPAKMFRLSPSVDVSISGVDMTGMPSTAIDDQITIVAGAPKPIIRAANDNTGALFGQRVVNGIAVADLAKASDATLADDPVMFVDIPPRTYMDLDAVFRWSQGAGAAGGVQYSLVVTGGTPTEFEWWDAMAIGTGRLVSGSVITSTALNRRVGNPRGFIQTGNTGSRVTLQWAQNTSNATPTTRYAGSKITARLTQSDYVAAA